MPLDAAIATAGPLPSAKDRTRQRSSHARARAQVAFRHAEIRALRVALYMRLVANFIILGWLTYLLKFPEVLFYYVMLGAFITLGYGQYRACKLEKQLLLYVFILADFLLLAFATLTENPTATTHFPAGLVIGQARELYFFILLVGVAACYDPRRVIWAGFCAMLAWTLGFLRLTMRPDAITTRDIGPIPNVDALIAMLGNPNFINMNRLFETLMIMAIVTAILTMVAYRARSIVLAEMTSQRERANLARHFAPSMVESLAKTDKPFDVVTAQHAAVLFADVVGFTKMAENEPPERIIGFLRALHMRLERAIFENGGTLDKYLGDGLMATFGAPNSGSDDATRAIAAARSIMAEESAWNVERRAAGLQEVRLSVGVAFGPVISGDIGSERRMEFATIGDAVNVSARLEAATRQLDACIVISAATAAQARTEDQNNAHSLLAGFKTIENLEIRGHSAMDVLALHRPES